MKSTKKYKYMKCYFCKGTGFSHYDTPIDHFAHCHICLGFGELDWCENVVGKEKSGIYYKHPEAMLVVEQLGPEDIERL